MLTPVRAFVRRQSIAKLLRYGAASAFNVVFGQFLLYGAQTVLGWSAVPSNVAAVTVGTVPAYLIARYWVWRKRGKNHVMGEVVPFWVLTGAGFVLSTVAVWFVEAQFAPVPLIINLTNLTAFGIVWVAKFIILDRLFDDEAGMTDEPGDRSVHDVFGVTGD